MGLQINEWSNGTKYIKNDIVTYNGTTFYSLLDNNRFSPELLDVLDLSLVPQYWADENHFTWLSSFSTTVQKEATKISIDFDDGYKKLSIVGINNQQGKMDLNISNIGEEEVRAIVNFLDEKAGEVFIMAMPLPYGENRYVRCITYQQQSVVAGVYSISIQVEETFYPVKPEYVTKTVVSLGCDVCDFTWETFLTYLQNSSSYDKGETGFGQYGYFLTAYCPQSGNVENFVVKCDELETDGNRILNYNPPCTIINQDMYSTTSRTDPYWVKPLNFSGMIWGYIKLSGVCINGSGSGLGQKPTANSFLRTYLLDGQNITLWVENFETAGSTSVILTDFKQTDGIVTPQFLPMRFVYSSTSNPDRNYWLNTTSNAIGAQMNLYDAVMMYWTIQGWEMKNKYFGSRLTTVAHAIMPTDGVIYSHNQSVWNGNTNDFRALCNPANRRGFDIYLDTQVGFVWPPEGYPLPNGPILYHFEPFSDGTFNSSRINRHTNFKLNQTVEMWHYLAYYPNCSLSNLGGYRQPMGTQSDLYGPDLTKIGLSQVSLQFADINIDDTRPNNRTIPNWRSYYFANGSLFGSQLLINGRTYYNFTIPNWIGGKTAKDCMVSRTSAYAKNVKSIIYGLF